ncbi:S46 family peptidase [Limnoglobus roseus]|uniref:Dipeptidyl-peptidase n=1 Tax=Limnoglobus roseus TaxID=2598579 RepID=A0A5C1AB61_9BACT|nr:S46 family peptidase [Limnoglobus roseus]QEL15960.1 S46 family peptidase [Limnoglobus roseus]
MRFRARILAAAVAVTGFTMTSPPASADEGMWLFNNVPKKLLKEKYNFEPTDAWLDHLQKASVRFNSGGSGSFVSATGLVMTNHHVGADDLQKLSTKEKDYLKEGFQAKTAAEEIKCKALELNCLQSIKDVTAEVNAAVKEGLPPAEAFKARQGKIAELEKANADEAKGVRADVVTLYAGGAYHLYTYKKYTDIRLVFAPEKAIAFFGGDPDNFEYPRYDLDMCFFRVYEDGKPIKPEHYLKWSEAGSKDGELTFVSGHPGRTNRQNTVAELEYLRDTGYPYLMQRLNRLEVLLGAWVARSEANRQEGEDDLFGIQNSRKARIGGLGGLLDPQIMARKAAEEKRLRDFIAANADKVPADAAKAFDVIAAGQKKRVEYIKEMTLLEGGAAFNSHLFSLARTLVRYTDEKGKPAGERLPEFGEARLGSLKQQLFSDEPISNDLELLKLADGLTLLATTFGADHELVKQVLAGKSPRERAYDLVSGTKLKDVPVRKAMFEGGADAADPMIALAKLVDGPARAIRKKVETEIDEPRRQAYSALAKARFAMDGTGNYPDATFTLRLAFGQVKGYKEDGKDVPPFTTMAGLYERSKQQENKYPFELPKRWEDKKSALDLKTPFNFVSTADIIGGNSGSPVVNAKGEVVGLIFDGNIQSLVLDFVYDQTVARAVSVDSRAMIEAMRKVYDATWLADELQGKK